MFSYDLFLYLDVIFRLYLPYVSDILCILFYIQFLFYHTELDNIICFYFINVLSVSYDNL